MHKWQKLYPTKDKAVNQGSHGNKKMKFKRFSRTFQRFSRTFQGQKFKIQGHFSSFVYTFFFHITLFATQINTV